MELRGKAIVLPTCPAIAPGTEAEASDLSVATMAFNTFTFGRNEAGEPAVTDVYVSFFHEGAQQPFLETGALSLPSDSDISRKGRDLAHAIELGDELKREEIKTRLCDRVRNCHGVVDNECWALGASALSEVIQSVTDQPPA
jgi:hypothetical protein